VGAGCGGSSNKPSASGETTAAASGDAKSILASIKPITQEGPQKLGIKLGVDLNGTLKDPTIAALLGDGTIALDLSGPIDTTAKAADLTFAATAGKINLAGGLRVAGDKAFLQLKDKWYELPLSTLTSATTGSNPSVDPAKILAALGDPSDLVANATVVGTEDIEGISTDHIAGDVDTAALVKAIARVATSLGSNTGPIDAKQITDATAQIEKFVKNAKVELWIGRDDKQVHRFKLDLDAVLDEKTKASSGLDGFAVTTTLTSTPTESPKVETPPNAGTVKDLQTDIGPIILSGLGGATP
jgi:hypothetical protein